MNYILDLTFVSLALSLASNVSSIFYIRWLKREHTSKLSALMISHTEAIEKEKKKPQVTDDARAILADLANGPALISVEYVDRGDVLLRSPRHT